MFLGSQCPHGVRYGEGNMIDANIHLERTFPDVVFEFLSKCSPLFNNTFKLSSFYKKKVVKSHK